MKKEKYESNQSVKERLKNGLLFDAVVFNVDSTLVTIEGLDWLADYKGVSEKVKVFTKKSMEGDIDFNTAMRQKMGAIAPSYADLELLGQVYCEQIVTGAEEVISLLQAKGMEVWILTGNFQPAVGLLAKKLKIPQRRVICNQVFFGSEGQYLGFDAESELSHNGGKAKKIQIVGDYKGKRIAFVGDGMTDLEVKDRVSLFVGFGGVAQRDIVKKNADFYISEPSLRPLLEILCSPLTE